MKIEIGESLLLSWLRHIKECQLVQLNWKVSHNWELRNKETLEKLMRSSSEYFAEKHGYNLYKGSRSTKQLIGQAEIDVMGICFEENHSHLYAIDVAFHEDGLNYGSRDETVAVVIKKCLRTAMCMHGYFGISSGTIIFASPKITPLIFQDLIKCIDDITHVLESVGLNYKIRIIANDDFSEKILEPVLNALGDVADTSELFMRSLQMYNLFAKRPIQDSVRRPSALKKSSPELNLIESKGIEGLAEMKIGVIVRTILSKVLESGKVSREEVEKMQTSEYSKKTFGIQYPLLQKASLTEGKSPSRYYTLPVTINGEDFFLCSEWYEVPANNDRPQLMEWLELHL